MADVSRSSGAHRAAADALLAAAKLRSPGPQRDQLFVDAVEVMLLDGDVSLARTYVDELERLPATAHRLQAQARIAWLSGDHDRAERLATAAWDQADELRPRTVDGLAAMLAQISIGRGDGQGAATWADRALSSGLLAGDVAATTRATGAIGFALTGHAEAGFSLLPDRALEPDSVEPERRPRLGGRACSGCGPMISRAPDLTSRRVGHPTVMRRGFEPYRLVALGYFAETEYRRGDWDGAAALADQAISLVDDTGQTWALAFVHAMAAFVPAAHGQWDDREPPRLRGPRGCGQSRRSGQQGLCRQRRRPPGRLSRRPGGSADRRRVVVRRWSRRRPRTRLPGLVRASSRRARRARSPRRGRARAESPRPSRQAPSTEITTRRSRPRPGGTRGRPPRDRRCSEGLRSGDRHRTGSDGRARRGLGALPLRTLLAHVEGSESPPSPISKRPTNGSPTWAPSRTSSAANKNSRPPGHARHPRSDGETHTLTPQEIAVTRLVCEGRTNREAASELFVSVKTISYHLGNVYSKLGVRSPNRARQPLRHTIGTLTAAPEIDRSIPAGQLHGDRPDLGGVLVRGLVGTPR